MSFVWTCQKAAEDVLEGYLTHCKTANGFIAELERGLNTYTSTRLFDWVDHFVVPDVEGLETAGFVEEYPGVYSHPGALLPRVRKGTFYGLFVTVESIASFLQVRGLSRPIEGGAFASYRRCLVSQEDDVSMWVVERRANFEIDPAPHSENYADKYLRAHELWSTRPRRGDDEAQLMAKTHELAENLVRDVGQDMAAWIVLDSERHYWQSRNLAAQIQRGRQDRLGMGWANHDHHTFRSSRRHFRDLVKLFQMLGFHCRERYYAGDEAGWGAQVMENSACNLVLFLDVDLGAEEKDINYSEEGLPERDSLGTIGLWCELHGDSIFEAGMHHLEAQFEFEDLTAELAKRGVGMMKPFSDFSYLKQAFTEGELWQVCPERIERLFARGRITAEQKQEFFTQGAIGSHLENLQRREGYKGFNQKNVSSIIKETDPRKQTAST